MTATSLFLLVFKIKFPIYVHYGSTGVQIQVHYGSTGAQSQVHYLCSLWFTY
jgi:hypothetical protein